MHQRIYLSNALVSTHMQDHITHLRSLVSTPDSFSRNRFIAQRSSHDSALTFASADLPIAFKKASGVEIGPERVSDISNAR